MRIEAIVLNTKEIAAMAMKSSEDRFIGGSTRDRRVKAALSCLNSNCRMQSSFAHEVVS